MLNYNNKSLKELFEPEKVPETYVKENIRVGTIFLGVATSESKKESITEYFNARYPGESIEIVKSNELTFSSSDGYKKVSEHLGTIESNLVFKKIARYIRHEDLLGYKAWSQGKTMQERIDAQNNVLSSQPYIPYWFTAKEIRHFFECLSVNLASDDPSRNPFIADKTLNCDEVLGNNYISNERLVLISDIGDLSMCKELYWKIRAKILNGDVDIHIVKDDKGDQSGSYVIARRGICLHRLPKERSVLQSKGETLISYSPVENCQKLMVNTDKEKNHG